MTIPVIRMASVVEESEVKEAIREFNQDADAGLPGCEIYIRENYITDCPGYHGPVAIVHWNGAPEYINVLLKRKEGWWLIDEDQI